MLELGITNMPQTFGTGAPTQFGAGHFGLFHDYPRCSRFRFSQEGCSTKILVLVCGLRIDALSTRARVDSVCP